jgi:putative endonuclease
VDLRRILGADGERVAERFLRRHRYKIIERNYRCPPGEIDLVALDGATLVFIEVKTRKGEGFGSPLDAVDHRKQRQVSRAAQYFLAAHRLENRDARFDVVGVWWEKGRPVCELIRNAFDLAV